MENIWKETRRQVKNALLQRLKGDGGLDQNSGHINKKMQTDSRDIVEIQMTEFSHDDSEVFSFNNTVDISAIY